MAPSDSTAPPESSTPEPLVARPPAPPTTPGGPNASAPGAFRGVSLEGLKAYLLKNFEQAFVLLTLIATVLINYFIPQKIAFLNFYFLPIRSEEHTSELQSLTNLVCRLLLEKKNK